MCRALVTVVFAPFRLESSWKIFKPQRLILFVAVVQGVDGVDRAEVDVEQAVDVGQAEIADAVVAVEEGAPLEIPPARVTTKTMMTMTCSSIQPTLMATTDNDDAAFTASLPSSSSS
jgi:hypothetical protein